MFGYVGFFFGMVQTHHLHGNREVFHDLFIHNLFNLLYLFSAHFLGMYEIKS